MDLLTDRRHFHSLPSQENKRATWNNALVQCFQQCSKSLYRIMVGINVFGKALINP